MRRLLTNVCLIVFMGFSAHVNGLDRANASFYIDTFGRVHAEDDNRVKLAEEIFKRLKRVVGVSVIGSKLVVIDAETKPWAIALADGNIIVSKGALDIIFSHDDIDISRSWMAFLIGHELAHLNSRDLWQQKAFVSLSANSMNSKPLLHEVKDSFYNRVFDSDHWRNVELKADELGYVIASLAGFNVSKIFSADPNEDFLAIWDGRTNAQGDSHYSASVRSEFLRLRLAEAQKRIDQFLLGIMLAYSGRYEDALILFTDFNFYFPSQAALTNLGYVHLQMALREMPVGVAYRYWIPTYLESESGIQTPKRSFSSAIPDDALQHLQLAATYLEQANRIAPENPKVQSNLVAAYWHLDEMFKARAIVEEALQSSPDNADLIVMKSLVLIHQEPDIDMWPRAISLIEASPVDESSSLMQWFNLARLHQERKRFAMADTYWNKLADNLDRLPSAYRVQVCLALSIPCEADRRSESKSLLASDQLIVPGLPVVDESIRTWVSDAKVTQWRVQGIEGTTVESDGVKAFVFNGLIELVAYDDVELGSEDLIEHSLSNTEISFLGDLTVHRHSEDIAILKRATGEVDLWLLK